MPEQLQKATLVMLGAASMKICLQPVLAFSSPVYIRTLSAFCKAVLGVAALANLAIGPALAERSCPSRMAENCADGQYNPQVFSKAWADSIAAQSANRLAEINEETGQTAAQCLAAADAAYLEWIGACLTMSDVASPPAGSPQSICIELGESTMLRDMFDCRPR